MRTPKNFPVDVLANAPFPLSAATESLRCDLSSSGAAINAQIANYGPGLYRTTGQTELRNVIGQMISLRGRLNDYFDHLAAEQPAAVQATLATLDTARQPVVKSLVSAGFDPSHPRHAAHVDSHPSVASAAANHEKVNRLPVEAWRSENDSALVELRQELQHLPG